MRDATTTAAAAAAAASALRDEGRMMRRRVQVMGEKEQRANSSATENGRLLTRRSSV